MNIEQLRTEWLKNTERSFKYQELLELLEETNKSSGKSRNYQFKDWERYFNFYKPNPRGHKFIITEIYDEPKPKEDGRINNGTNPNSHHNQRMYKKHQGYKLSLEESKSIGVYRIILNNDVYIGSTTVGFRQRFLQHLYRDNTLATKDMLDKGGMFEIIEIMNGCSECEIREKESGYILKYNNNENYNLINKNLAWNLQTKPLRYFSTSCQELSNTLQYLGFKLIKKKNNINNICYFVNNKKLRKVLRRIKIMRSTNK